MSVIVMRLLCLLSSCSEQQYDEFYRYNLILESPKTDYRVGERVKLVASIISERPATIRVYKDRRKSFNLSIRQAIGTEANFTDSDFGTPHLQATSNDDIEVIKLQPGQPFRLELQGQILSTKSKEIIFDFGKFGTFKKPYPGNFLVWGYWQPISPSPIDPLEDYTESILLKVAR
jgi:hypothetical protein